MVIWLQKIDFHWFVEWFNWPHEENCSKSDYVINSRPIWVQKHWPGSVTGVACYGWSTVRLQEVRGSNPGGIPLFVGVNFKWDHHDQLGLISNIMTMTIFRLNIAVKSHKQQLPPLPLFNSKFVFIWKDSVLMLPKFRYTYI